jgi:hypothetical protein
VNPLFTLRPLAPNVEHPELHALDQEGDLHNAGGLNLWKGGKMSKRSDPIQIPRSSKVNCQKAQKS